MDSLLIATPIQLDLREQQELEMTQTVKRLAHIDHHEARLYHMVSGTGTEHETLHPYDPHHIRSHLTEHASQSHYQGQRAPEDPQYYAAIAKSLQNADEIILMGEGHGHSNAAMQLTKYLGKHAPETLDRVIAVESLSKHHSTEKQLLARARAIFRSHHTPPATPAPKLTREAIDPERWIDFCATFSNGNHGRRVSMLLSGGRISPSELMHDQPFFSLAYDTPGKGDHLDISVGADEVDYMHVFNHPEKIFQWKLPDGEVAILEAIDSQGVVCNLNFTG